MPYILKESRVKYDGIVDYLVDELIFKHDGAEFKSSVNWGHVNYVITRLIRLIVKRIGLNYSVVNSAMGVLTSVSNEFYRRIAIPYEDKKKDENGDMFIL
jgi:hypothetical protein